MTLIRNPRPSPLPALKAAYEAARAAREGDPTNANIIAERRAFAALETAREVSRG